MGHHTMTIAKKALRRPDPSAAATAMARKIGGKASVTSTQRIRTLSVRPPKNPAIDPTIVPIVTAERMTATDTGSVCLAPYSTRVNTSRLSASVPNQWSPLGGCSRAPTASSGEYGAHHCTVNNTISQNAVTIIPKMTVGRRHGDVHVDGGTASGVRMSGVSTDS